MALNKGLLLTKAAALLMLFAAPLQAANVSVADGANLEDSGNLFFTVTRDSNAADTSFTFTFTNGTAVSPGDWTVANGSATLPSGGPLSGQISVPIVGDTTVELDETVNLTIVSTSGDTITDGDAIGTILNDDSSTVMVTSPSATEGSAVQFEVSCTAPIDVAVSFDGTWNNGTATGGGDDFTIADGTAVSFADGCSQTWTPTTSTTNDNTVELDETLTFTLSALSAAGRNVTLGGPGTGTIQNDDSATLTLHDRNNTEGSDINAAWTLSNPVDVAFTFDYATADGTATTADSDYTPLNNSWNVGAGVSGLIDVAGFFATTADSTVELDEIYNFVGSNIQASGRDVTFADDTADLTINNDDAAVLSLVDASAIEGAGIDFICELSNPVDTDVSFDFGTDQDTATDGVDYPSASGTKIISSGASGQLIVPGFFATTADDIVENDEIFHLLTANLAASGRDVTFGDVDVDLTILNDDVATLSINDVTQPEGSDLATTPFVFTVSSDTESAINLPFTVATQDGTAWAGQDYNGFGATGYTILSGTTSTDITVDVVADNIEELDEWFFVNLGVPVEDFLQEGDIQGVGTIENDDEYPIPTLSTWSTLLLIVALMLAGWTVMRRRALI